MRGDARRREEMQGDTTFRLTADSRGRWCFSARSSSSSLPKLTAPVPARNMASAVDPWALAARFSHTLKKWQTSGPRNGWWTRRHGKKWHLDTYLFVRTVLSVLSKQRPLVHPHPSNPHARDWAWNWDWRLGLRDWESPTRIKWWLLPLIFKPPTRPLSQLPRSSLPHPGHQSIFCRAFILSIASAALWCSLSLLHLARPLLYSLCCGSSASTCSHT